ncbi:MAG: HIT family protein [Bacteroidales bacterium]|nr:HIT family protein [Bacteroidales bacterium]
MATIFTKIINGEIPCYKVAEDEHFIAFLDINPLRKGHTLVVPKEEVDYLFKNSDEVLASILLFAKRVSKALEQTIDCKRVGLMVLGLEVPHTHIHLIPINDESDMNLANKHVTMTNEEFVELAAKLRSKFV